MKNKMKIFFTFLFLLCLFICYSIWNRQQPIEGPEYNEIYRVSSPDSLFDVVYMTESRGGALGSIVEQAYVVPIRKKSLISMLFMEGVHLDSVKISWTKNNEIYFRFKGGRLLTFVNHILIGNGLEERQFEIKQ